ncbi:MAG: agmatine deiminase family protein [Deltaproteobacteria bacterium]|nr:agmatine deiminase family protein [Deltaproteobacteria bacterium]
MRKAHIPFMAILFLGLGCELQPEAPPGAFKSPKGSSMLPAWPMPHELKVPGKADQYSDYRLSHPDWYAITQPPARPEFLAFREWEPMMGVMLAFPSSSLGQNVTDSIVMMVVEGIEYVDWYVIVPSDSLESYFVNQLKDKGLSQAAIDKGVTFLQFDLNSIWGIDFGPFPVLDPSGDVAFTDFRYYHQRTFDDAIPTQLGNALGVTTFRAPMDWEGGHFQTDESGTCYFSQGTYWENPDKTEAEVHKVVQDYLGCKKFIVLKPIQDGTSHMDMFSKLTDKNTFVLGKCTTDYCTATTVKTLDEDADILKAAVLADGTGLTVHRIPMPYQNDGVWRTFTNSTLANGVNLWPVYSQWKDLEDEALDVWRDAMPGWTHVGINSDVVITWGGAQHCVSRNLPDGNYVKWIADGKCDGVECEAPEDGYSGACQKDGDCFGPAWQCECNDCSTGCKPPPDKCEGITFEGCCTLDGFMKYCENNSISTVDCKGWDQCGWSPDDKWYDCGFSAQGPEGFPKACPGEGPCGDIPEAGVCDGDVLKRCQDGKVSQTDCAADGKVCGEDADEKPACACPAACNAGDSECLDNGLGRKVCAAGENGCFVWQEESCADGFTCSSGDCKQDLKPEPIPDNTPPSFDPGWPDAAAPDNGGGFDVSAEGVVEATASAISGGGCSVGPSSGSAPMPALLLLPFFLFLAVRWGHHSS